MQKHAVAIQLVFWAFDLVDDAVDGDQNVPGLTYAQQIVLSHIVMMKALNLFDVELRDGIMSLIVSSGYGEFEDISFTYQRDNVLTEDNYIKMVTAKSGRLMELIAVIIDKDNVPLRQFMINIGIAAQIKNDIQGIENPNKSDFKDKKMYLPLIKYMFFSKDNKLEQCTRENIIQSGALEYCRLLYNYYIEKAYRILFDAFPTMSDDLKELKNEFNF
ncbi:class 1 isoprenoid biosynthesis enzyme [Macrococcus equi]|uniref:class 1 isoprenoid biosynthesis enzyme n=1 Tax=Macrococcus equi TaxID=3395462 RepID=UPI0039BE7446